MYTAESTKKCDIPAENLIVEKDRWEKKLMVSGYVSKIGKGKLLFFEEGEIVNAQAYHRILQQHLRAIRRLSGSRPFTFMQDGETCHTETSNMEYLRKSVPDLIEKDQWPSKSCDINPLDYAIWGLMDTIVYRGVRHFDSVD